MGVGVTLVSVVVMTVADFRDRGGFWKITLFVIVAAESAATLVVFAVSVLT